MADDKQLELEFTKEKKVHVKNKWLSYTFGAEPLQLEPYEIDPVTDIPIRLAVEKGVISRKRDLRLFRLIEEWNGHAKHSIVIAGPTEEGQPFAVWIGDGSYAPIEDGVKPNEPKKPKEEPSGTVQKPDAAQEGGAFEPPIKRRSSTCKSLFASKKKKVSAPVSQKRRYYDPFKKTSPLRKTKEAHSKKPKAFLTSK